MFKKLALVTAIAALPVSGFAMEALEDSALSGVTGQDGISINLDIPALVLGVNIHDNDGLGNVNGVTATGAGAIVISNMGVTTGAGGIDVVIDADGDGGAPVLNIGVTIPTGTTINTGDLSVAVSNGMGNAVSNQSAVILDSMGITLGATTMNIQLGAEPQGNMIALNTVITGGITITNFSLNDATAVTGGSLSAASIAITGTAEAGDITTAVGVDLDSTSGLVIGVTTLGTAGLSLAITDLALGNGTSMGDVEVVGLNLNGSTITVSGH